MTPISICTEIAATSLRLPVQRSTNGSSQKLAMPAAITDDMQTRDGIRGEEEGDDRGAARRSDEVREDEHARAPEIGLAASRAFRNEPVDDT